MSNHIAKDDKTAPVPPAPDFVQGFCDQDKRRLILVAAVLASSMSYIDGSVISIAMPALRQTLDASLTQVQWVHNAYLMTLSALVLVGGAFGDRFGLARVFGLGIALFVGASMVCAAAPSAAVLIPARALQGIGAALMVPGSLAILSRAYPREERGAAIGIWAAASAVTTAAGPIVGGLVLSLGGPEMWRWIFAVNLPLGALALWMLWRAVDRDPRQDWQRLDLGGAGLATLALGTLAWSLTGGEGRILWAYLGAGAVLSAAVLWWEARHPAPMLDLGLFRSRAFKAVNLMTLTVYFAFSTIVFYLPMLVISSWGMREIDAAAAFAPLSIFIGAFSARAGRLADRYGARPLLTLGCGIMALSFVGLALVIPDQAFWSRVLPCTTLMALGMGLMIAPLSTAVMTSVADTQSGAASGVNNAIARIAGLLSIAAMGGFAAVVYASAGGGLSFGETAEAAAHVAASNRAFAMLCWVSAGLAGVSAAIAWLGLPRAGAER